MSVKNFKKPFAMICTSLNKFITSDFIGLSFVKKTLNI